VGYVVTSLRDFKQQESGTHYIHRDRNFPSDGLLPFRFLGRFLRGFFFEVRNELLYFRGIWRVWENLQIFIVGFGGLCVLVFLFVSLAQKFPRRRQSGLIVRSFDETFDRGVVGPFI